jgi:hypothetical protein
MVRGTSFSAQNENRDSLGMEIEREREEGEPRLIADRSAIDPRSMNVYGKDFAKD